MIMEGIMVMLRRAGVKLRGKHACVIGCSDVVGLPMTLMLLAARYDLLPSCGPFATLFSPVSIHLSPLCYRGWADSEK